MGKLSTSFVLWWHRWRKDAYLPLPWTPEACRRTGPEVTRMGEMSLPSTSCNTQGRGGPAPHLDNIAEPTLLAKVCMSQPQSSKSGRPVPTACLSCICVDGERCQPLYPLSLAACNRWASWPSPLTSCCTQESGYCFSSRRHSRAGPVVRAVSDPALMSWAGEGCPHCSFDMWWQKQQTDALPHPLPHLSTPDTGRGAGPGVISAGRDAVHAPHQLEPSEEWPLHLAWATQ